MDYHTQDRFYLDCNTGKSFKIDLTGLNPKTYHTGITGVVKSPVRVEHGMKIQDKAMIPEIDASLKLKKPDVT